uniref:Benzoate 4-monooxygenase cytochrome p450 n=1 Tax=Moniliophthora roreri TaxID=221103 RepID=A0A0W0G318_MONRR
MLHSRSTLFSETATVTSTSGCLSSSTFRRLGRVVFDALVNSGDWKHTGEGSNRIVKGKEKLVEKNHDILEPYRLPPEINLLLLGAGECGKTTLLKQLLISQQKFNDYIGTSDFLSNIAAGIVESLKKVVRHGFIHGSAPWARNSTKSSHIAFYNSLDQFSTLPETQILGPIIRCAEEYVRTPSAMLGLVRDDNTDYFLSLLDKLMQRQRQNSHSSLTYTPSETDAIRCYVKTCGIHPVKLTFENKIYRVFDCGGQRAERKKWRHCAEQASVVVFVASLSEYDQVLVEDPAMNRMIESQILFHAICRSTWFTDVPIILILNKRDVLERKLRTSPINRHFTDYLGGDDVDAACDYFARSFASFAQGKPQLQVYLTSAIDVYEVVGPVVRVGPNELHFSDPAAYADIYSSPAKLPKDPHIYKVHAFGLPSNVFTEVDPKAHAVLKSMLGSFFSRQGILKLEGVIQDQINKLLSQLIQNHKTTPANMKYAFRAATFDIITRYTFRTNLDMTSYPSFKHPIMLTIDGRIRTKWVFRHFPFLVWLSKSVPKWLSGVLIPASTSQLGALQDMGQLVDEALRNANKQEAEEDQYEKGDQDVFYTLIRNAGTKYRHVITREYLVSEGMDLRLAGSGTVANACTIGSRYLVKHPEVRRKLQTELDEVWPDKDQPMPLERLEKLPYLTAVIKESLRLSHGVVTPMSRVVSDVNVIIAGHAVPPGTVVGIANTFVHLNTDIFPDPTRFYPERWLDAKDNGRSLDRYLVAFGKGPRTCLGINLAWSEMYMILGNIFRKLEFKNHNDLGREITFRDVWVPLWEGDVLSATVSERG